MKYKFYFAEFDPRAPFIDWQKGSNEYKGRAADKAIIPGSADGVYHAKDLALVIGGRNLYDCMWAGEIILQDRVVDLLESEKLTGWILRPVSAVYKTPGRDKPPRFREMVVTGWGGAAPPESGIEAVPDVIYGFEEPYRRQYSPFKDPTKLIDVKNWDGSDFFRVWPVMHYLFVTQRLVDAFHAAKITGMKFTPIEYLPVVPHVESNRYRPGRLAACMPDPWASKYGVPLGIY
jgi:hypothetical protein